MESREKCVPCKTCVPIQINVYLTDSERATNEEASIRENEFSAGTLTNPRTQVTNQHPFRIRTRGAKGPYYQPLNPWQVELSTDIAAQRDVESAKEDSC